MQNEKISNYELCKIQQQQQQNEKLIWAYENLLEHIQKRIIIKIILNIFSSFQPQWL